MVVTEDSFLLLHLAFRLSEIAVADVVLEVLPAAVAENLEIFFLMCQALLVVVQLVDDLLGRAFLKVVEAKAAHPDKAPALGVHSGKVGLLLFMIQNAEVFELPFGFHLIKAPPVRFCKVARFVGAPYPAPHAQAR